MKCEGAQHLYSGLHCLQDLVQAVRLVSGQAQHLLRLAQLLPPAPPAATSRSRPCSSTMLTSGCRACSASADARVPVSIIQQTILSPNCIGHLFRARAPHNACSSIAIGKSAAFQSCCRRGGECASLDIDLSYLILHQPEICNSLCLVGLGGACTPSALYCTAQQPCLQQAGHKNGKGAGPQRSLYLGVAWTTTELA